MLAITRRFRNGTVYVLDTDDMVCEDATISDIIEIEEKGYHVEHLADSIYSEKYGDIVFFFRWHEHDSYGVLYAYDARTGKQLSDVSIPIRFKVPKGKNNAYVMAIEYFHISYFEGVVTLFLYDKHYYDEDCGADFAVQIPFKRNKFGKPKKDAFTLYRR